ncbi:pilus assembly protein TadG-related protein [Tsuneonella sp. HG222]
MHEKKSPFFKRLLADTSGNALMMMAMGAPALIGSAGLATDAAQWYMWKRELQFAVDQAALAGAHARASSDASTRATYSTRATQEYNANVSTVSSFDGANGPSVSLAIFGTATANNSVVVTASATKRLPFSSLFKSASTVINVRAQATYTGGVNFTACMLALNPHNSQAVKTGNSINGTAACGLGSLSDDSSAIFETGDSSIPFGTIVATGGVEDSYSNNGTIYEDQEGLANPYEGISAPSRVGQPNYEYPATCPVAAPASTTYTAEGTTRTHTTYVYKKGANAGNGTVQNNYTGTGYLPDSWSTPVAFANRSVTSTTTIGLQAETTPAQGTATKVNNQNGNQAVWRIPFTSTQDTINSIIPFTTPASDGKVHLSPGIYPSLHITCATVFEPGVYFVDGLFDLGQNKSVTGTGGVMFVLTSASGSTHVNADSTVNLSGISESMLINTYGYSTEDAAKMAGMLIWDPDSTSAMTINGNAQMVLNGILYMPQRDMTFNGNGTAGSASGSCMMVAADMIKLTGNFSVSNFCVTTGASAMSIGGTSKAVKLVA